MMNNNNILNISVTFLLFTVLTISCNKAIEKPVEINQIIEYPQFKLKKIGEVSIDNVDSYLVTELKGRVGSCDYNEISFWGSFNSKTDEGGILSVENYELDKIVEGDQIRYLKTLSASNFNMDEITETGNVNCSHLYTF